MTTPSGPGAADSGRGQPDPGLSAIMSERRQLINLTYRLLGSLAEAEDAVQETYARWYALSRPQQDAIESPGAWLTTVASRICLNVLGSARARRERYVGEWIPEPLPERTEWISGRPAAPPPTRPTGSPSDESVGMAFLVVLEAMTPAQRVAFILHDVFGYSFTEVADIVWPYPGRLPPHRTDDVPILARRQAPSIPGDAWPRPGAGRRLAARHPRRPVPAGPVRFPAGALGPCGSPPGHRRAPCGSRLAPCVPTGRPGPLPLPGLRVPTWPPGLPGLTSHRTLLKAPVTMCIVAVLTAMMSHRGG